MTTIDYVGYCRKLAVQCPGPDACGTTCKREPEDQPFATFEPTVCQECDNEVEGVCSVCDAHICGSCFNGRHEYRIHGTPVVADGFPDRMPTGHDGSLDG